MTVHASPSWLKAKVVAAAVLAADDRASVSYNNGEGECFLMRPSHMQQQHQLTLSAVKRWEDGTRDSDRALALRYWSCWSCPSDCSVGPLPLMGWASSWAGTQLLQSTAQSRFLFCCKGLEDETWFLLTSQSTLTFPACLARCMRHGEISLPDFTAATITDWARSLQRVATTFSAIQWNVVFVPAHSTRETGVQLQAELLDGENSIRIVEVVVELFQRTTNTLTPVAQTTMISVMHLNGMDTC